MKEATGELNMTVITVVAIAAIAGVFYAFIWPSIQNTLYASTACSNSGGQTYTEKNPDKGYEVTCGSGKCTVTRNGKTYTKDCDTK